MAQTNSSPYQFLEMLLNLDQGNPQFGQQWGDWSQARMGNKEDPFDLLAFLQHLQQLNPGAYNTPAWATPDMVKGESEDLRDIMSGGGIDNPNITPQFNEWSKERRGRGETRSDLGAFAEHLFKIGAPTSGKWMGNTNRSPNPRVVR